MFSFKFIMLNSYVCSEFTIYPERLIVVLIFNYGTGNITLPRVRSALDVL